MKSLLLFLFIALFSWQSYAQDSQEENSVPAELRRILESFDASQTIQIGEQDVLEPQRIVDFYTKGDFVPVWTEQGKLHPAAKEVLEAIEDSKWDGLIPQEYHLEVMTKAVELIHSSEKELTALHQAYLDIIFTDAYFALASDLYFGKVSQEALKTGWRIQTKEEKIDIGEVMKEALETGDIKSSIQKFWPRYQVYRNMRNTIKDLSAKADIDSLSWKSVSGKLLKVGDQNKLIPEIRQRLAYWGDYSGTDLSPEMLTYDSTLREAVIRFQARNGLDADGVMGKDTYEALSEGPGKLVKKAAANLERLRWLPDTVIQDRFVMVNIANFHLDFLRDNGMDTLYSSRVIVGKEYHSTPVFNGEMAYLVLSPTWTVPSSIIRNEMVPKAKKDPSYLSRNHLNILTYQGKAVSAESIDWATVTPKTFPYMIRQSPGAFNSLGQIKFIFPNQYHVYIHDTPAKSLFDKGVRAFSHGCIRLENPQGLAEKILENDSKWTPEKIHAGMNAGKETTVMLKEKIPVVLIYLTFWTDSVGNMYNRKDIYERDKEIEMAMFSDEVFLQNYKLKDK